MHAVLYAFDLIELDGNSRRAACEPQERIGAELIRGADDGIAFNQHSDVDGRIVFELACALGCEGIVSKRLGLSVTGSISRTRAPAVRRETEEDGN